MYFASTPQVITQTNDGSWNTVVVDSQFDGLSTVIVRGFEHKVRSAGSSETWNPSEIYDEGPNIYYINVPVSREIQASHDNLGTGTLEIIGGFTAAEVTTYDQSQFTVDLTSSIAQDDSWTDLDISANLTGSPIAAIIMVSADGNDGNAGFGFGQVGNTTFDTVGATGGKIGQYIVPVVGGSIRVRANNFGGGSVNIHLVGQVNSGLNLVSAPSNIAVAATSTWETFDISASMGSDDVAWIYGAATFGFDYNAVSGANTGRVTDIRHMSLLPVQIDGSGQVSLYSHTSAFNSILWTASSSVAPASTETILDAPLVYGSAFSGSYSGFSGVPENTATVSDGTGSDLSVAVTITDNGDGTGTFSGTMPSLPAAGQAITGVSLGNVTFGLTDPGA